MAALLLRRVLPSLNAVVRYAKCAPQLPLQQYGKHRMFQAYFMHTSASLNGETVQFQLADIGEGIAEVLVTEWYVEVGDVVEQFDQICEVKSDKASVTITSRYAGTIKKLYYEVDEEANVGKPLVDIEIESDETEPVAKEHEKIEVASTEETLPPPPPIPVEPVITISESLEAIPRKPPVTRSSALATPAVRKIAKENNIDITNVLGTGRDGRVLKEDLLKYIQQLEVVEPVVSKAIPAKSVPPVVVTAEDIVFPIKGIQKIMVKSMEESLTIPHFGYCDEMEVSNLVAVRKALKRNCKQHGVNLSYMPFFLKAASMAMLKFPIVNSSLNIVDLTIIQRGRHNIGVAMDTKDGLLVPNIKDVHLKSVFQIAQELNRLHDLGVKGKLGISDLTDGTFSLSNIGSIGGTYAKPVITPPQVAIGALGKMHAVPRFDQQGELFKANIINVSWAADHRVIDGATMARFSNLWKSYLEEPSSMLLDLK